MIENYIVFAPGSGELEKHKRWPYENYSKLANLLIKNNINIIVIGSKNEKNLLIKNFKIFSKKKIISISS